MVKNEPKKILIAGAGVAGLSIALAITRRSPGVDVVVLEHGARPGGNIRTDHIDGYTCEWGPDGFLDNAPATLELVRELGLTSRLLPSNDAARRRFLFHNGQLAEVPTALGAFLKTPLLSPRGKLRILREPFATLRRDDDESILDFAQRRIGPEAAAVFVDPMVSGVFAGDAEALSLKACFPRMRQIEDKHGSLVRGLIATRRSRKQGDAVGAPSGRLTSFIGGMSDLIDALVKSLGPAVRTGTTVRAIRRNEEPTWSASEKGHRYAVTTSRETIEADAVVLSGPAAESAAILRAFDPALSGLIERAVTAPVAVVCLGYDAAELQSQCRLDGFGFLVPKGEGVRILGTLWETSIYQHRAPAGKVLLRVMIGGARDPEALTLSDDQLVNVVRIDLARTMKVLAKPRMVRVFRHPRGIPQYVKGHLARMHQIDTLLTAHPGVLLAGNSYRGVSINACIADAAPVAEAALRAVDRSTAPVTVDVDVRSA